MKILNVIKLLVIVLSFNLIVKSSDETYLVTFSDSTSPLRYPEKILFESKTLKNLIGHTHEQAIHLPDIIQEEEGAFIFQLMSVIQSQQEEEDLEKQLINKLYEFVKNNQQLVNLINAIHWLDISKLESSLLSYIREYQINPKDNNGYLAFVREFIEYVPKDFLEELDYSYHIKMKIPIYMQNKKRALIQEIRIFKDHIVALTDPAQENKIIIYNFKTGKYAYVKGSYNYFDVSKDGTIAALDQGKYLHIFDKTGKEIFVDNRMKFFSNIAISQKGIIAGINEADGYIYIMNKTGEMIGSNRERSYLWNLGQGMPLPKISISDYGKDDVTIVATSKHPQSNNVDLCILDKKGKTISVNKDNSYYIRNAVSKNGIIFASYWNSKTVDAHWTDTGTMTYQHKGVAILDRSGTLKFSKDDVSYWHPFIRKNGDIVALATYDKLFSWQRIEFLDQELNLIYFNEEEHYTDFDIDESDGTIASISFAWDGSQSVYILKKDFEETSAQAQPAKSQAGPSSQ